MKAQPMKNTKYSRCVKCGGYLYRGGVRFGIAARDIVSCANCGLTNESSRYLDAVSGKYVEMNNIQVTTRHHHIGGPE